MENRPGQSYSCHCKGCYYGFGSSFEAAPEEWYIARGMTPPKNCPDCRKWIKNQRDEKARCSLCKRIMRLPARYKISHHKKTGPWVLPDECLSCERGERPPTGAKGLPDRRKALRPTPHPIREQAPDFTEIADGIPVKSRVIAANPADYQHWVGGETRQVHIEHHIEGSPHSWVGKSKSPSAMARSSSFNVLLSRVSMALHSSDPATTREYLEGNKIVRLTLLPSGKIERTIIKAKPGPNGHELITTFDHITVQSAINRYGSKKT